MEKFCVNYDFLGSDVKICKTLAKILGKKLPVIVCIGTDAVVGDCLGPLVGSLLKERLKGKTYVFGTVESPVTAKEVQTVGEFIKNAYPYSPVLAIDAALGSPDEIGSLKIADCPIKPGLGVDKNLQSLGTASIMGVVEDRDRGKNLLSTVRFSLVYKMAKAICGGVSCFIENCLGYE
ncbi:MAG: spore protease YyaC [Clostridia bacterium]|nr:spore protease YyaC [Clostridia bacterium]